MQTHLIDPKQAITAYQAIVEHGQRSQDGYCLEGIRAATDIDGYTVYLSDDQVALTVYYHYKYQLEYNTPKELAQFKNKLAKVLAH